MISKTRPPAVLSVCRESRIQALTIYKAVDDGIRTKTPKFSFCDRPIYVNPEVDIVYRNKFAGDKGDAFRMRCKKWVVDTEPMAFTPTLAVDLIALISPRKLKPESLFFLCYQLTVVEKRKDELDRTLEDICIPEMHNMVVVREIAMCAEKDFAI